MEKLLRCCDIAMLYILIRCKNGKSVSERYDEIFSDMVFDKLKLEKPNYLHRITMVTGDCSLPLMGLSTADRQILCKNVNIVFHVAATVRFNEKLGIALRINVLGTRDILLLSREMDNLKVKTVLFPSSQYF